MRTIFIPGACLNDRSKILILEDQGSHTALEFTKSCIEYEIFSKMPISQFFPMFYNHWIWCHFRSSNFFSTKVRSWCSRSWMMQHRRRRKLSYSITQVGEKGLIREGHLRLVAESLELFRTNIQCWISSRVFLGLESINRTSQKSKAAC